VTRCQLVSDKTSADQPASSRQKPVVVLKMGGRVVAKKSPKEVASKLKESKYFIDDDSEEDKATRARMVVLMRKTEVSDEVPACHRQDVS
jgi:hypothetical protein